MKPLCPLLIAAVLLSSSLLAHRPLGAQTTQLDTPDATWHQESPSQWTHPRSTRGAGALAFFIGHGLGHFYARDMKQGIKYLIIDLSFEATAALFKLVLDRTATDFDDRIDMPKAGKITLVVAALGFGVARFVERAMQARSALQAVKRYNQSFTPVVLHPVPIVGGSDGKTVGLGMRLAF